MLIRCRLPPLASDPLGSSNTRRRGLDVHWRDPALEIEMAVAMKATLDLDLGSRLIISIGFEPSACSKDAWRTNTRAIATT